MSERIARRHVCIITHSIVTRDARILRQIEYLRPHYHLTVLGYGDRDPSWTDFDWIPMHSESPESPTPTLIRKPISFLRLLLTRIQPSLYARTLLHKWPVSESVEKAASVEADLYWANDWVALPAAVEAARRYNAKVLFDAHEYAPLEWEQSALFRFRDKPLIDFVLLKYAPECDGSMTVCGPIAQRYAREYGLDPIVVRNAPKLQPLPASRPRGEKVRLVHHGGATRLRRLERMIDAIRYMDERFTLTFMLVGNDDYIRELRQHAERVAAGRVSFVEPVAPIAIVSRIAEFDLGFYLLDGRGYNDRMALPNKFFDFLLAGLGVCIGPSPAMAELVREYDCGMVSPSIEPRDVAAQLNALTSNDIDRFRKGALRARTAVNADTEMAKALSLVSHLLQHSQS